MHQSKAGSEEMAANVPQGFLLFMGIMNTTAQPYLLHWRQLQRASPFQNVPGGLDWDICGNCFIACLSIWFSLLSFPPSTARPKQIIMGQEKS